VRPVDHLLKKGKAYEARVVIPHCPSCSRPCCALETVVLEMTWPQAQQLYQIKGTKQAFLQALHDGEAAPALQQHLKESHGKLFAHGAPCPAYRADKSCGVYGTAHKPSACGEFPIYADGDDALTVDLRCEAIDLQVLDEELQPPRGTLTRHANAQFPFLVTYQVKR
jgi:Fe-S-cluster containining protein